MKKSFFILTILLALPSFTRAESILVNAHNYENLYTVSPMEDATVGNVHTNTEHGSMVHNAAIQVEYPYTLTLIDKNGTTLGPVSCGSTITSAQKVVVNVPTPTTNNVYWFNTGGAWDTPYGDVISGAGQPGTICTGKNAMDYITGGANYQTYGTFSMNPPTSSITPGSGFTCTGGTTSTTRTCTPQSVGAGNISINVNPTYGLFYGGIRYDYDSHNPGVDTSACYWNQAMISVPGYDYADWNHANNGYFASQNYTTIPGGTANCSIDIIPDDPNAPSTPEIIPGSVCSIVEPMNLSVKSTSPGNRQIRYLVDWDGDGSADQIVPTSGYVPSNQVQNITRSFSSIGSKSLKVRAQDEAGSISPWLSYSFNCVASCPVCSQTNVCNQTLTGTNCGQGCKIPGVSDINSSCIPYFWCSADSVGPNGSIECKWKTSNTAKPVCGFIDLTTPTPRPIPGLQNLDPTRDNVRITNIQTTTRFCLVCQFYSLVNNSLLGEAAVHQWVRVIRIGEN